MRGEGCFSCRQNAALSSLPPRERVASDEYWRVAHAYAVALPGWLVLVPRRHVTAIADLTAAEAAGLGSWLLRLSAALRDVLGCAKTYVAQFAEADGFIHVHFHIVPRMPDLPEELRGPRIFDALGRPEHESVDDSTRDDLALRLQGHLSTHTDGPG